MTDKNLIAADFESSDAISRWDGISDYAEAEYMSDDELYAALAGDFESSDGNSRYDYIDETEPFDMDGTAEPEPELYFDFACKSGEDYYIFEAKMVEPEKIPVVK
jgi:hypothetical protein